MKALLYLFDNADLEIYENESDMLNNIEMPEIAQGLYTVFDSDGHCIHLHLIKPEKGPSGRWERFVESWLPKPDWWGSTLEVVKGELCTEEFANALVRVLAANDIPIPKNYNLAALQELAISVVGVD